MNMVCLVSSALCHLLLLLSFFSLPLSFHSRKDDVLGCILKPTVASPSQSLPPSAQQSGKLVSDDLDSSLANLVGSMCLQFVYK